MCVCVCVCVYNQYDNNNSISYLLQVFFNYIKDKYYKQHNYKGNAYCKFSTVLTNLMCLLPGQSKSSDTAPKYDTFSEVGGCVENEFESTLQSSSVVHINISGSQTRTP